MAPSNATAPSRPIERRWDIDWLRTATVLLLVPYHTARLFDTHETFYVKNAESSAWLTHWVIPLGGAVGMQLLFLLAGAATCFALRTRTGITFVKERTRRLVVPLIFGTLVLVPPQTYIGLLTHSDYTGSVLDYYPRFFEFEATDIGGYSRGGLTPAHLWFILFLFLYSLLALPLFRWLRGRRGRRFAEGLASVVARPGMVLLFAVPFIGARWILENHGGPVAMLSYFFTFYVAGCLLASVPGFEGAVDRHKAVALLLGPVLWVVLRALPEQRAPEWLLDVIRDVYDVGIFTWFTIVALLGYGRKLLVRPNRFLGYFGEAAYPFYILHQTVLVVIAFYLVRWHAGVGAKYVMVAAGTFAGTMLVYELAVRRNRVARFLFGMRPRHPGARAAVGSAPGDAG